MGNKDNLLYFEGSSMRELYQNIHDWQKKNGKQLHSMSIHKDNDIFSCIALSNPSEVVIVAKKMGGAGSYEEIRRIGNDLQVIST